MNEHIIYQVGSHLVKNIDNKYILKEGSKSPFEDEMLKFIRNNTNIPVPKVIDSGIKNNKNYILMERIDGETLEKVWNDLNKEDIEYILKQLKEFIYEMRKINFSYIGSINHNPCYELFISDDLVGPFKNNIHLNNFRIENLNISEKEFLTYLEKNKNFETEFVLTHNDLGPYNILIKNRQIVGIIDWELSGSYPSYWEYNRTVYHTGYEEKWKEIMKNILKDTKPNSEIDNFEKVIYYLDIYSNPQCDNNMKKRCKELTEEIIKQ